MPLGIYIIYFTLIQGIGLNFDVTLVDYEDLAYSALNA